MKKPICTYFIEVTDTSAGEANYCWVRRYLIEATSERVAIQKLSKESGYNWRIDYKGEVSRYNAKNACVCAFIEQEDNPLQKKEVYSRIVEL